MVTIGAVGEVVSPVFKSFIFYPYIGKEKNLMITFAIVSALFAVIFLFVGQMLIEASFGYSPDCGELVEFKSEEDPFGFSLQRNKDFICDMAHEMYKSMKGFMPTDADVAHLRVVKKKCTKNGTFFYVFKNMTTGKKFTSFVPDAIHYHYNDVEACHWAFEKFEDKVADSYRALKQHEEVVVQGALEQLGYA